MLHLTLSEACDILLRTGIVYLLVVLGMRLMGKREIAQLSVFDFVFVLLIASAVQDAMVGDNNTLTGGLLSAAVLFGLNWLVRSLMLRSRRMNRLFAGDPVVLVYQGKMHNDNMRKVRITKEELLAVIREHGLPNENEVDLCMLEVNGEISVLSHDYSKRSARAR